LLNEGGSTDLEFQKERARALLFVQREAFVRTAPRKHVFQNYLHIRRSLARVVQRKQRRPCKAASDEDVRLLTQKLQLLVPPLSTHTVK
jgi:hypothetical protein